MIFPRPITATFDPETHLTRMIFDGLDKRVSRDFYCMGSVAWPEGMLDGFALSAGQDVKTGQIWIFEEYLFMTVQHWFNDDGSLNRFGLLKFLQDTWNYYRLRTFVWSESEDVHFRYARQVWDNPNIMPQPEFIRTRFAKDTGDNLIAEYLKTQKVMGDVNSQLFRDLKDKDGIERRGVHALRCLLAGYEYMPYGK
ncbi:MAG: hypothetical protein KJ556_20820 [Gammaproteobacteria bacterium]|nr:hypothetical protein [Gammaproteobacteria bacterium]